MPRKSLLRRAPRPPCARTTDLSCVPTNRYEAFTNTRDAIKLQRSQLRQVCRELDESWPTGLESVPFQGKSVSLRLSDAITLRRKFIEGFTDDDNLAKVKGEYKRQFRQVFPVMKRIKRRNNAARDRPVAEIPQEPEVESSSEDDE